MIPVSILILTYNEQANIRQCLENATNFSNDVFILDSYSNDETLKIAREFLPVNKIFQRKFDNYSNQRNWALDNLPFKYEWLLALDADEVLTKEVAAEISSYLASNNQNVSGFRVKYRFYFMGKALPYRMWPFSKICFIKHRQIRYSRSINELPLPINGNASWGHLQSYLLHRDKKNLHQYLWKHNRYSTMEALERSGQREKVAFKQLFSTKPSERKKALKSCFYRLPARPLLLFIYMYFFKFGFLAGKVGLQFCLIQSFQQLTMAMKIEELKNRKIISLDEYKQSGWE